MLRRRRGAKAAVLGRGALRHACRLQGSAGELGRRRQGRRRRRRRDVHRRHRVPGADRRGRAALHREHAVHAARHRDLGGLREAPVRRPASRLALAVAAHDGVRAAHGLALRRLPPRQRARHAAARRGRHVRRGAAGAAAPLHVRGAVHGLDGARRAVRDEAGPQRARARGDAGRRAGRAVRRRVPVRRPPGRVAAPAARRAGDVRAVAAARHPVRLHAR
mmetsp:Transcript_8424/g.29940  ORF Transcript_8424/g.29940 Transcript_8424/m.29940 type:complete len:220 (-) Transcript_8424:2954-3613(-)